MEPTELTLANARIVLADQVLECGWVRVEGGRIAALGEGQAPAGAHDLRGDYLVPGLIELHTDHLESHFAPRPKVRWHPLGAVLAYDAQIAASGITTVFDSLRAGVDDDGGLGGELLQFAEAIDEARRGDLFRADHFTHLRCEVPSPDVIETVAGFVGRFPVGLISLMDHTPGQRQFRDIDKYLIYYGGTTGQSQAEIAASIDRKKQDNIARREANRPALVDIARRSGIPLASHDVLDVLSSDYVPGSLLMAAFDLPRRVPGISLPAALATVTKNPAAATGLGDRGEIAAGKRADLVRVRLSGEVPVVQQVWREGRRVA